MAQNNINTNVNKISISNPLLFQSQVKLFKTRKQITTVKAVQISGTIKCIAPEKSKLPLQRVFGLTPCQPHPSGNSTLPLYFSSIKGMEIFTDTHNLTIIIYLLQIISLRSIDHLQPGKTADILRCQCWFPHKMTWEKWGQKFHTDDSSPPRSGKSF